MSEKILTSKREGVDINPESLLGEPVKKKEIYSFANENKPINTQRNLLKISFRPMSTSGEKERKDKFNFLLENLNIVNDHTKYCTIDCFIKQDEVIDLLELLTESLIVEILVNRVAIFFSAQNKEIEIKVLQGMSIKGFSLLENVGNLAKVRIIF